MSLVTEWDPSTRGYTATKSQLLKRLARVEGQVRGVDELMGAVGRMVGR